MSNDKVQFNVRMKRETRRRFDEVCEFVGLNKGYCLDLLINMYYDAMIEAKIDDIIKKGRKKDG